MTNETQTTNPVKTNPRRWFRFRLRTLLVMVTLWSVALGWVGWELDQRRREKATIAWVEEMGGRAFFHSPNGFHFSRFVERSWWEETKDKWFGERVLVVNLNDPQTSDLSPLTELKNLKQLTLWGTPVSDLSPLVELKNLEHLVLQHTLVSDLSHLAELKQLKSLSFIDIQVSDLSPLAELKHLERLGFMRVPVSEEQYAMLRMALPDCQIHAPND